ncbi:hypothetical protein [Oerskovia flava]|uniref:hypothetical protein n=1 Tax=Oerskovia flava TaxID=2986422 RepID=UPI00224010B7|nr:hypothetical protein [Oerskovia sp. JB1-3-2]
MHATTCSLADLLHPTEPVVPTLVRPADVGGHAAWQELVRSGALVPVRHETALVAGTPPSPAARVETIRHLVPSRTVVGGASAAWVHVGSAVPRQVDVVYLPGTHRPPPRADRTLRQAAVLRSETVEIGGVLVAGLRRAALEVASTRPSHEARQTLSLLRDAGLDLDAVARSLELRLRWPGRATARDLLATVSSGATAASGLA